MFPALLISTALALGSPSLSFVSPAVNQALVGTKVATKVAVTLLNSRGKTAKYSLPFR